MGRGVKVGGGLLVSEIARKSSNEELFNANNSNFFQRRDLRSRTPMNVAE